MKNNIFKYFLLAIPALVAMVSCEDRELIEIDQQASSIVMDLSAESVNLDSNFPNNPALTISWSAAEYSVPSEIKYEVEVSATESFETPQRLTATTQSQTYATITNKELNEAAQKIGLVPFESQKMYLRVKSFVGTDSLPQLSNVTSLMVTPYVLSFPDFFLVGEASYVGWTADKAQLLYKKDNFSYIYTYLENGKGFRFLGQQDWNPINYSIDASGIKDAYKYFLQVPGTIAADGDENMKFSGETGIYKIKIDATPGVQTLSIDASPIPSFDAANLYLVGTIGGNNWTPESGLPMNKVSDSQFEFTTSISDEVEFKILGQQSWEGLEWANIDADNAGYSGFLGPKGDNGNIKFTGDGGDYKITVNLKAGIYSIVKI